MPTQTINGNPLYYEIHGTGAPLIFIHGLGGSLEDWNLQVPFFAAHFKVIVLDLRGHGRSGKPRGGYSMPMFAADVAALLNLERIGPAHVVGLSLGGGVAFQLALDSPDLVRSLTIVNSGPELILRTFREKLAIWSRFAVIRLFGLQKLGEIVGARLFPRPQDAAQRQGFLERYARNQPHAYTAALRAFVGWSVTAQLGALRCPTLFMSADQDYTPVSLKQTYVDMIPGARLVVIPDSHHAAPAERPEAFNALLLDFLAGHS